MNLPSRKTLPALILGGVLLLAVGPGPAVGQVAPDPGAKGPAQPPPVSAGVSEDQPKDLVELQPTRVGGPDQAVLTISKEALEAYATFFPGRAMQLGVKKLFKASGDYRKETIASFVATCRSCLARLEKIAPGGLTDEGRVERDALRVYLRGTIRQLETSAALSHDPNFYLDESIGAIQHLLDRGISGPLERIGQLKFRMQRFPQIFSAARENLGVCPRSDVQRALTRLRASTSLFGERMTAILWVTTDPPGTKVNLDIAAQAEKDVAEFAAWLEKEKLPKAAPPASLGPQGWVEWLRTQEDEDVPAATLVAAAAADLARLQEELQSTAKKIPGGKDAATLIAEIGAARLEPWMARQRAERVLGELWAWTIRNGIVGIPDEEATITVREAPPLRRREAPIRANLPGGFVVVGKESFLELAAPDPTWSESAVFAWLEAYSTYYLPLAAAREAFPGRFVAYQYISKSKVPTCKAISFQTMDEGWPLYSEELAVRQGFRSDDPRIKVAMLTDMIRADARLIASVRLHAMGASGGEMVAFLEREAYISKFEAAAETLRLLASPDGACPGLGRLAILALRDDLRRKQGDRFVLRTFHEKLLAYGSAPISVMRRILLGAGAGPMIGGAR